MKLNGHSGSGSLLNFLAILGALAIVLFILFGAALGPGKVLFSNDGPLGALKAAPYQMPGLMTGSWFDLNTLGYRIGGAPNITYALQWLLGPTYYSKLFAPVALFILGLGAWTFFRQLGLTPVACLLGGLAACLNSSFLSAAAWGMSPHPIAIGMSYFALAALVRTSGPGAWIRVALAGLAVGISVAEGGDIGAIFSLGVAAFIVYQGWAERGGRGIPSGMLRTSVVALFAAFIAAQTIVVLVGTAITGVAGMGQESQTKQERWDWATQWSLPKREALGFIVPGVFGYRMDTPEGGNYWGAVGRDPAWDRYFEGGKQGQPPQGFMRFTGGGGYCGILVIMIALWGVAQGIRKRDSAFGLESRKWIWFWTAVLAVSLLLAFGRFAPFYQILYSLPYFSTIRNPSKFTHVFSWAIVVLFAYGVHGLWTRHVENPRESAQGIKKWWATAKGFDRLWSVGCLIAFGLGLLGWLIYGSSRKEFVEYLQQVQFDEATAQLIAAFSSRQVGIWLLLFGIAIVLVTLVLSGAFSGARAKWGALLLGLFVVADLGRANKPWIIVWDYEKKYASNEILDILRNKPDHQRVAAAPGWMQQFVRVADAQLLEQLYRIEWAQHHFYFYNIPSLDIVQLPRMPEDLMAFEAALQPKQVADLATLVPRRWEVTSTRYLLGAAELVPFLNQQLDPGKQRFSVAERFAIVPKPGVDQPRSLEDLTAVTGTNGPYALIEFSGALPRAKLYSKWQVETNDQAVLEKLAGSHFDPHETVLLSAPPAMGQPTGTNESSGTVAITSYTPKRIILDAQSKAASVLLLTDRFDPNWKVYVDGSLKPLLKPNFLMRGVFLEPGQHKVEFKLEPPVKALYVSLAAWVFGIILIGLLVMVARRPEADPKSA